MDAVAVSSAASARTGLGHVPDTRPRGERPWQMTGVATIVTCDCWPMLRIRGVGKGGALRR